MTQPDDFSALDGPEMAEDPLTNLWDEPLRRAQDEHAVCLKRWAILKQHDPWKHDNMTTFHGTDAHLRSKPGRGRLDYLG